VELEQVKAGRQTVVTAAERPGMGGRQGKRIGKRYRTEGAKGLVHRSRGRRHRGIRQLFILCVS
jgi:hypothetical protein